jgi:hypothetical protein
METDTTGRFANSGALTEVVAAPINIAHKPNLKVPKMGTFIAVSKHEARYLEAEGKQKPQTKRKAADVAGAVLKKSNEPKPRGDDKNLTGQPWTRRLPEG